MFTLTILLTTMGRHQHANYKEWTLPDLPWCCSYSFNSKCLCNLLESKNLRNQA